MWELWLYSQLSKHFVALLEQNSGVSNKLINDGLGGFLLVHNSGDLTHEEGTGVIQSIVINVIGQVLHVVLNGDDTLRSELLDLLAAVLLPVDNVGVLANTKGTALYHLSAT